MTLKEAISILDLHNRWRRGDDTEPMVHPTLLGEAIDFVVQHYKNHINHPT